MTNKKQIFKNVGGNQFRLLTENVTEIIDGSNLVREGLKKVFSAGGNEISYTRLANVGLGYIKDVTMARKCALQEARDLAEAYEYTDDEKNKMFTKSQEKSTETNTSNPEEKREVQIGNGILESIKLIEKSLSKQVHPNVTSELQNIGVYANELVQMHS